MPSWKNPLQTLELKDKRHLLNGEKYRKKDEQFSLRREFLRRNTLKKSY